MPQNTSQLTATGSYSDSTTQNITNTVTWTVSDTSIATVNAANGLVTIQPAGQIWGGTIGVTATLAPGTPGTASLIIVASDSGSVAPRMPFEDSQWSALGLSPWGSYWGFQEGAGNPVSSGSNSLTLTAVGVSVYSYSLPNWTRKFVNLAQSTTQRFSLLNSFGPPPNYDCTGSMAMLVYGMFAKPSATSVVMGTGNANLTTGAPVSVLAEILTTGVPQVYCSGSNVAGIQSIADGRVHPVLLVYDKTNLRVKLYTDLEKVTGSVGGGLRLANSTTASLGIGNASVTTLNSASGSYGFFAFCTGSVAESFSDDGIASAFMKSLGWSLPW